MGPGGRGGGFGELEGKHLGAYVRIVSRFMGDYHGGRNVLYVRTHV